MIPYAKHTVTPEDIEAVVSVLRSDFLTTGPTSAALEAKLCEVTGARFAITCSNGTAALHLACLALGLEPGDSALTSAITFVASANCAEYCGARAGFVDIDPETLCLSIAALEAELVSGEAAPKVVIPVDFGGVPADLPRLQLLAKRFDFRIIADCAHSIGSSYCWNGNEYQAGSCAHSDLATFSFHPVKSVTSGEGGAVTTNDPELAERLRLFRSHGLDEHPAAKSEAEPWSVPMKLLGYRYRMSDIQSALALSQLNRLPEIKARRQEIFRFYCERFKDDQRLSLPPWPKETSPCFHLFPLRLNDPTRRKDFYLKLLSQNVRTQIHYRPVYRQPYYRNRYGFPEGMCPNAEDYYRRCVSLPLFPGLTADELELVATSVERTLGELRSGR